MAQRRMFSKTITNSSQFLMMPNSAQNLYFHLGMNADDDGFVEHFAIMRMTDSKPDDLRILVARGYVHAFDDRVLVILDWKENNYIQKDRYQPSKYLIQYKKELSELCENKNNLHLPIPQTMDTECIQDVYNQNSENKKSPEKPMDTSCIQNGYSGEGRLGKYIYTHKEKNCETVDKLWTEKITPHLGQYAPSMIRAFENHWRQRSDDSTKELWQMEKIFDVPLRLETWKSRDEKWEYERKTKHNA